MDLLGLAARLTTIAMEFEASKHECIAAAVKIAEKAAKDRIGHENGAVGPVPAWEPLAPATMESREALGFSPDEPLLRTGELRDSITSGVEHNEGYVGSPLEKALFAEIGTGTQPPRSFLVGGYYDKKDEIEAVVGQTAVKVVFK